MTGTLAYGMERPGTGGLSADEALGALYAAHYRRLARLAALLLDDPGGGEEVTQDAYVKLHAAWRRVRDPQAAEAYLRTTVINLARSRLRRRRVAERHRPGSMPDAESAEHAALRQLEHEAVLCALDRLPTRQRECLVLRYYADLSEVEIAEAMQISPGAVKSHAARGIAALRTALEESR